MRKRRKRNLRILIATAHSQVSAALQEAAGGARVKCKTDEALSVRGVYEGLPGVDLAIIDLDGLIDSLDLPRDTLVNTLETSAIPVATSEEFVAEPMAWLEKAVASTGLLDALPPRTVVFAGSLKMVSQLDRHLLQLTHVEAFQSSGDLPVQQSPFALAEPVVHVVLVHSMSEPVAGQPSFAGLRFLPLSNQPVPSLQFLRKPVEQRPFVQLLNLRHNLGREHLPFYAGDAKDLL